MDLLYVYIPLILVLLFLSMFFSSADMAYGSVNHARIARHLSEHPTGNLRRAEKLSRDYDKTISTILLFNDTINAALDTIATMVGVIIATNALGIKDNALIDSFGLAASLIVLILKITFGEIIAKSLGKIYNYRFANLYSAVITVCYYVTIPITFLVGGFGTIVCYPITHSVKEVKISDDELHEMIDEGEEEGIIDEDKAELLRGTVDYASTETYEIMTPRAKIYAIDKGDSLDDILANPNTFNYSRIPVYEGTIDNIIGYVRSKTLIRLKLEGKTNDISDIIEHIQFFPRTTEINDVLNYFKKEHEFIAIVLDEYGGTEGLITREDIIEEIVGEIWDETDDIEEPFVERNDGSYIIDGGMNLEDFCNLFDIDFESLDTEYVTIGGFIIELLDDKFANKGDELNFQGVNMKVIALGKHHTVKKILCKKEEVKED